MGSSCRFCGMAALDGAPCCTWEFKRDRIMRADREIAALRAENDRLRATPPRAEVDVPSDGTRERLTRMFDKLERQLDVDDDDAWMLDRTDIEWIRRALSRATGGGGVSGQGQVG